jgi:hypothetical protein
VQRQRENTGEYADSESPHEQDREQQIGHRAAERDDGPRPGVHSGVRCGVSCGQKSKWRRDHCGKNSTEDRHQQRVEGQGDDPAGVVDTRWKHACEQSLNVFHSVGERRGREVDVPGRQKCQHHCDRTERHKEPASPFLGLLQLGSRFPGDGHVDVAPVRTSPEMIRW